MGFYSSQNALHTHCKYGYALQDFLRIDGEGKGRVVQWLRAQHRTYSGFGALLISLGPLCDGIPDLYNILRYMEFSGTPIDRLICESNYL